MRFRDIIVLFTSGFRQCWCVWLCNRKSTVNRRVNILLIEKKWNFLFNLFIPFTVSDWQQQGSWLSMQNIVSRSQNNVKNITIDFQAPKNRAINTHHYIRQPKLVTIDMGRLASCFNGKGVRTGTKTSAVICESLLVQWKVRDTLR